jgi:phage-related protein
MAASRKRLTARFYRTAAGNEPVLAWLRKLDRDDMRIVGTDLRTVELGWPIGMPVCRPIGRIGLREVRSTIKRGKVEARIYFGIDAGNMLLLHAAEKGSTQSHDIQTAEARWADYRTRKER